MIRKMKPTQKAAISSKIQTPIFGNQLSEEEEAQFRFSNGNFFDGK